MSTIELIVEAAINDQVVLMIWWVLLSEQLAECLMAYSI
jgi:hypothetical protein